MFVNVDAEASSLIKTGNKNKRKDSIYKAKLRIFKMYGD
jgi:hypothetical protein